MIEQYQMLTLSDENRFQMRRELLREFFLYLEVTPAPLEIFLSAVAHEEAGARYEVSRLIDTFLAEIFSTYQPTNNGWRLVEKSDGFPSQMVIILSDNQEEALDWPMWLTELYNRYRNDTLTAEDFSNLMWRTFVNLKHPQRERRKS
jgi:hypothetical protein